METQEVFIPVSQTLQKGFCEVLSGGFTTGMDQWRVSFQRASGCQSSTWSRALGQYLWRVFLRHHAFPWLADSTGKYLRGQAKSVLGVRLRRRLCHFVTQDEHARISLVVFTGPGNDTIVEPLCLPRHSSVDLWSRRILSQSSWSLNEKNRSLIW